MSISAPSHQSGDAEAMAGAIYRYYRDTNMILMNRDGKLGKGELRRLAEKRALADMHNMLDRIEQTQNGQRPPDPEKSLLGRLLP